MNKETSALLAVKLGHINALKKLKDQKFDFSFKNSVLFKNACLTRRRTTIIYLLKNTNIDPSAGNNQAFINLATSRNPQLLTIKMLLQDSRIDPSAQNNKVLKYIASEKVINQLILKELLKEERVIEKIKSVNDYNERIRKKLTRILLPRKIEGF